jgi:hypothetical protein
MTTGLSVGDLANLPAAVDLATACRALSISRNKGYDLLRDGAFPVPALRLGSSYRFRGSDLRRLLLDNNDHQPAA